MLDSHFVATLFTVVIVWIIYAIVCVGFGWVWKTACAGASATPSDFVWAFWTGLATLLGLLQIWHLFRPIDGWAYCALITAGSLLSLRALPAALVSAGQIPAFRRWSCTIVALLLALWIADRSAGPGNFYDSGLYHIPAMQWASHYRIIPGLGNLHYRLGFTSSIALLNAMMDQGFSAGRANHYVNGFLLTALGAMVIRGAVGVMCDRTACRPDHWVMLFCGLAVFEWAMDPQISSLSTDIATVALTLAAAACFLQIRTASDPDQQLFLIFVCCMLCAADVSAKASAMLFTGPLALCALWEMRNNRSPRPLLVRLCLVTVPAAIVAGVWILRQIILTGYPLYPSSLLGFSVDWRMPKSTLNDIRMIFLNWGRTGTMQDTTRDYSWVHEWIQVRWLHYWDLWKGAVPLGGGILTLLAAISRRSPLRQLEREWTAVLLMLLIAAAGLAVWFATGPEIRYATQLFVLLFAGGSALFCATCLASNTRIWPRLLAITASIAVSIGPLIHRSISQYGALNQFANAAFVSPGPDGDFQKTPTEPHLREQTLSPGVVFLLPPAPHDQVWDAPLPNAPYLDPNLRLRNPPHLQDGFKMQSGR